MHSKLVFVISLVLSSLANATTLTLTDAFQAALGKDERVHQSTEQISQVGSRMSRIRGGLFPEISFNGNYLIQPEPDDPIAKEFSPPRQTTASFQATQPIFRGFREFVALRQQDHLYDAQEANKKRIVQELYAEVATAYLNVLTREKDLTNLKEQVEIYEKRVAELKRRTQRGESNTTELLLTQSTQNSLLAERRLVEGQVKVARETLHSITGQARDADLQDPLLIQSSTSLANLETYLDQLEKRSDVKAALDQADAASNGIWLARGSHLPTIDAVGNYYLKRPGFFKDLKWDVSLRLVVPLFAGGATQAQVNEAASKNKEAELELARTRRRAEEEIRNLHESLRAKLEHLEFLKQSEVLAEKNVSVSQSEFRRGLIRSIDVQTALAEYRNIRRTLDQAYFAAQADLVKLQVATGTSPGNRE